MNMRADFIIPGQLFAYRERGLLFRAKAGAGQVLGCDLLHDVVYVRIFNVTGEVLRPLIELLPIRVGAYVKSGVQVLRRTDVPGDWEALKGEWFAKMKTGDAGVFSRQLPDVTRDIFKTIEPLHDGDVVEIAYPVRVNRGDFRAIRAVVRKR